jgi:acyl-CoA dehydrogenase
VEDYCVALDTETLEQLVQSVRRFVRERLRPLESLVAIEDAVPSDVVSEMRQLGLFGLSIPDEYGGLNLGMYEECLIAFELGGTSPAFRSVFGTNVGIGSQGIVMGGTPAQKARWLPSIASGEIVTSFALTEPQAGSDAASVQTRAEPTAAGYRLTGSKRFITNADKAGLFTVIARLTTAATRGDTGLSAFLVPAGAPGLTVHKPYRKMGQQGAHICDVSFDGVFVGADQLLGEPGKGFALAMRVLDRGRLHISSVCVGAAQRLLDDTVKYAAERTQFGQPIGEFQLVQGMLADSYAEMRAARALVMETARAFDQGQKSSRDIAAAKLFASEMVGRVADRAVQVHGGAGYVADYGIERFYRDVRLFRIYEGTSQIQQLIIARSLLG